MGFTNFPNDFSIDAVYHQLNDIHSQLAQNRENIASLSSKLELATSQNISDILINLNNHKFELKEVDTKIKNITNNLDITDGKLNQVYLELSELKKLISENTEKINSEINNKQKLFSLSTGKEIIVAIFIAIILTIGGGICKTIWDSYIERETAHRQSQIQLVEGKNNK